MSSCKDDFIWDPKIWDCEYNKTCKIDEYLEMRWNIKWNIRMRQYDEILNTAETTFIDKKEKNNCLSNNILLIIICLLLFAVISI